MRTGRLVGRLLAGTVLALIVAAPTLSISAPERVQSARPLPPSLNGQSSYRERTYRQRTTPRRQSTGHATRAPNDDVHAQQTAERYRTIHRNVPAELRQRTSVRREATPLPPAAPTRAAPPSAPPPVAVQPPAKTPRSAKLCAPSSPPRLSVGASRAPPSAKRCRASTPRATMRRCGFVTAASPHAPRR
jgi:hypothetical protein